jgi:hypothetical protein
VGGDLVALLFGHGAGGFAQCTLELRRGMDVFHLPAASADEVVVVTGELLGEFETAVIVGACDPAHHADVYESCHVPISAALGELWGRGQDLRDGERTTGRRQCLDEDPPHMGVPLVHARETQAHALVNRTRDRHGRRHYVGPVAVEVGTGD